MASARDTIPNGKRSQQTTQGTSTWHSDINSLFDIPPPLPPYHSNEGRILNPKLSLRLVSRSQDEGN